MKVDELEKIINSAFEDRQNISEASDQKILNAINQTIELTDKIFFLLMNIFQKLYQSLVILVEVGMLVEYV